MSLDMFSSGYLGNFEQALGFAVQSMDFSEIREDYLGMFFTVPELPSVCISFKF
jgi:hypothetical protein